MRSRNREDKDWPEESELKMDLKAFPTDEVEPQLWMGSLSQNAGEEVQRGKKRRKDSPEVSGLGNL